MVLCSQGTDMGDTERFAATSHCAGQLAPLMRQKPALAALALGLA
jgi:hypothetical protein